MTKTKSPKMSLEGWSFTEWVKGNYKTIKEIIKVGVPYVASTYLSKDPAFAVIFTTFGKLVLDSLEYWYKKY